MGMPHAPSRPHGPQLAVRPRPTHALVALALLAALAGLLPASVAAAAPREPWRPLPGYRPTFVTETDEAPPWKDCLWAAGTMLIDKWTAGHVQIGRETLRRLSGDRNGGSTFVELGRAFDRLGMRLTWSPEGGDYVTWPELLDRLSKGGGAVLLGDYGKLPRRYGRWDPSFWKKDGTDDNHALYLDGYDRRYRRVWVMDPLAPKGWDGEWVPLSALMRYAWRTGGGGLWVAMTLAAQSAPFANVILGVASASLAGNRLDLTWPITSVHGRWSYPGADLVVETQRLDDAIVADGPTVLGDATATADLQAPTGMRPPLPPDDADPAGSTPTGTAANGVSPLAVGAAVSPTAPTTPLPPTTVAPLPDGVAASLALPTAPGAYRVQARLVERRFGRTVASAGPYTLFVPGDRHATIAAQVAAPAVSTGETVGVAVLITNTGSTTWADTRAPAGGVGERAPSLDTSLVAHWIPSEPDLGASDGAAAAPSPGTNVVSGDADLPDPIPVAQIPLAPGASKVLWLDIPAPRQPGAWTLVLDPVDAINGSFAAGGNRPVSVEVFVAPKLVSRVR